MRIERIRLQNYRRFTDLLVRDIPESAKLVLVVGPNGCGKSSLFDGLLQWHRGRTGFGYEGDESYHRKSAESPFNWGGNIEVKIHGNAAPTKNSLYIRTAYRNDPDFSVSGFSRPTSPAESPRITRAIQNDQAVGDNYQRLVYDTMAGVYDTGNASKTVGQLRDELIGDVRASMERVFGDLVLNTISDPLGAGAFFFQKGAVKAFHYKNLSGGEKAAFDLLLDLHVKKRFFPDAIYCIDELETHLHTRVQGALLREMVRVIPTPSQLWLTTHSLGTIRAAQEMAATQPGSVAIIDFEGVLPDVPNDMTPSSLGRVSWGKLLSIALDDLSARIAPKTVVVCEGSAVGTRRRDFDAEIYNRVLGRTLSEVVFVSGGASNQVASTGASVAAMMRNLVPTAKVFALADRDDKSSDEVAAFEASGNLVLPRRNLESYLFDDEVMAALAVREGKANLIPDLTTAKATAIANSISRGNPPDDLKSAAGEIYTQLKARLGLQRAGNNTDAFMRDTLAPLIVPTMACYAELETAVRAKLQ